MASVIRSVSTTKEIEECVRMYYFDFLPVDREYNIKKMTHQIRNGHFVRVWDENGIKGWIHAFKTTLQFNPIPVMQQMYFSSNETGFKLYRILKGLHEALIEEAERQECQYVVSCSSPIDEKMILAKLLEKAGWERRGYMCVYKL
jgi:hypothetical protein